jgi:hypothetical protein
VRLRATWPPTLGLDRVRDAAESLASPFIANPVAQDATGSPRLWLRISLV